jgi:hypothetical protein
VDCDVKEELKEALVDVSRYPYLFAWISIASKMPAAQLLMGPKEAEEIVEEPRKEEAEEEDDDLFGSDDDDD